MFLNYLLPIVAALVPATLAAFGITTSTASYVVDAGSTNTLVITISRSTCDITSIKFRGVEVQSQTTYSHINSGLGSATVTATTVSSKYAKITCSTSTLTHYYVVSSGEATVYMATYISAEPTVGEFRYIARLDNTVYPDAYPFNTVSTTVGHSGIVGAEDDVFIVGSQTRSKYYSSERFIDDLVHCVNGTDNHACFLIPQKESSSGGPFFRDIDVNNGGPYTSLTNYMNSGHTQIEAFRMGLHGPYALTFTRSGVPAIADYDFTFMADLSLTGYVATSARGYVSGTASGVGSAGVVHWFNTAAQYWAYASSTGTFKSPAMKPGTYTMRLYKTELPVASTSVTVTAGGTVSKNIANSLTTPTTTLWTIGTCDGQPTGFRNADKFLRMHPSDSRMSSWGPLTYTVGTSSLTDFPMAIFQDVNAPQTIKFTLTAAQASGAATLRVRTTLTMQGGRPSIEVNSWSAATLEYVGTKVTRGVTVGHYSGEQVGYEVVVPAGTLVSGSNSIEIGVDSGTTGNGFLSPSFVVDCVEFFR